jgi:hypothetical protein
MFHLAQYNIARARAPLSHPLLADFVAAIESVNAAAEQAQGFVWRLKDESGASSSYVRAYDDERMLINLSVWESSRPCAHTHTPHRRGFPALRMVQPHDGPSWKIVNPGRSHPDAEESREG